MGPKGARSKAYKFNKEGSKENIIWEEGAQKFGKGSKEQQKNGKQWSKEQEKSSGSKRRN